MAESVTINFLGDIYLGKQPYLSLTPEVMDTLKAADLVIANQEGPITNHDKAIGGKCCLRSASEAANILQSWHVNVATLANNHMFDYGWQGFEQTKKLLEQAGIAYLGAGKNLDEATQPLILESKGIKVGLLSYSWEFVQTTCATDKTFGCAPLEKDLVMSETQKLRQQVDVVIVMPHWGYCDYLLPTPEQVSMAKSFIDAGATAVVGHHSHVAQGIMSEAGKLAAFSLGNFAFARYKYGRQKVKLTTENLRGIILKLVCKSGEVVSHELIHTKQENATIVRNDSERHRAKFAKRQAPLASDNYAKYWRRYLKCRLFKRILYWMNILNWKNIRKGTIDGAGLMLKSLLWPKPEN